MTVRAFRGAIASNYGPPTDKQLSKINSRLEKPLTSEEVFVFRSVASNRNRDSYYSIMGDTSLRNYAADYDEGRSFMNNHRTGERATGRTFESEFNERTGEVVVWTYTVRGLKLNDTATDDFIRGVETGLIQDVSIHFTGGRDICNLCNKRLYSKGCRHLPGIEYEDERTPGKMVLADFTIDEARAVELSDAWKGSTPDAGILRKAALLRQQNLLDDNTVREFNSRYGFNLRGALEGEEYLKFEFEKEESDDDKVVTPDGHTGTDGDGADDPDPVTGLKKGQAESDAHVNDKSNLDGRNTVNKTERETARKLYTEMLETRAAELDPEDVEAIRNYLRELDDDSKDPMPPKLKDNKDNKDDDEDDKKDKGRFFKPKDEKATVISCIRALGNKEPLALPNSGELEPGKGDMAGMIMPGQEPLQNVSSEMFSTIEGEALPTDAELVKGLTELNSPLLTISPEGIIGFFFDGKGSVVNGEGVGTGDGLLVPGRSADSKDTFKPIVTRLNDPEQVRELVNLAIEGQQHKAFLRNALYDSLRRYGCMVHGNKFDTDFHLTLARAMNTDKLLRYVEDWKNQAQEKFRTNPETQMHVSEFTDGFVNTRQTVTKDSRSEPKHKSEPLHLRNELFQS